MLWRANDRLVPLSGLLVFAVKREQFLLTRCILVVALLGACGAWVLAQEDPRQAAVDAATADAYASLRREVLATSVGNDQSIGDLVDRCRGREAMEAFLQSAQQVGGPRWLGDQTVQVRLELPGDQLASVVQSIAAKRTSGLAMPLHVLRRRLEHDIARRTFGATGSSTSSSAAERLRPDPSQTAWQAVGDAERRAAIDAARRDAVDRTLDSLRSIESGHVRLGDAIALSPVSANLRQWLANRPITSIEFHDDLEVRIALAASPTAFFPVLRSELEKQRAMPLPKDARQWDELRQAVQRQMRPPVGVALAHAPLAGAPGAAPLVILPHDAPAWIADSVSAEAAATARPGDSKLRTARAAETLAVASLRSRLDGLPLTSDLTIGQAAKKDPHVEQAVERGLGQVRITKVDYDTPAAGSVRIRISLPLEEIWRELSGR